MATNNKIPKCPPLRFPDFNDDWRITTLGEIASFFSGGTPSTIQKEFYEGDIPFIRSGEIHLKNTEIKISESALANSSAKLVEIEDILLALYGATSGDIAISQIRGAINQAILCIRPYCDFNKHYVFYHWQRNYNSVVKKYLQGGQGNLSAEIVKSVLFRYPSASEQKKIADFLSLIDERIQSCSETIKERKREKAGLLNQLFSQKLRFPDFNDEWTQTTLGEIAERVTRKNNGHVTSRPLTISAQYGLIDQRDFFNKIVASTSLEGYYLLNKGEFAYNRSSSADYPWGAIKRLESYENGALSTLYICFSLLQGYPSFIAHFFETSRWHEYIQSIAAEGARNHGLLNISVSDFFALPISLPSLSEQKKIADFLSLVDERMELEEQLLKKYEEQKKYLLRQMFV